MQTRRTTLVGLAALAAAALAPRGASAQTGADTLTVAFPRALRTLDGNFVDQRENDILGLLTDDALFAIDAASGKPVPLAARAAKLDGDTRLVVQLRDDVRFHDGARLTADDVVYTFGHLLDPKSKHRYQQNFSRWLAGVDALAPDTVVFRMKEPYAMAQYDLAMYAKLRKKGTYADPSRPDGLNPDAQTLSLNGTGPYRVTEFRPGQQVKLQRVDGYRNAGPKAGSALRTITIRIIPDWGTQAAEVMAGGVHWTFGMPIEIAEGAAATKQARLITAPSMRVFYLSLDATGRSQGAAPLKNVLVRRAINHAINSEGIARNLVGGTARAIHTACDPVQFGCDSSGVARYAYDSKRARALLAQAGYAQGFEIDLWAARDRPVVEVITAQLRAAGIRAQLRYVQGPTLSQARREGKVAIEFTSSGSFGIPDVGALLPDRLGPGSDRNASGDDELGQMIVGAGSTYNEAERKRRFSAVLQRIAEQAYWVPLYVDSQNFLVANGLQYTQAADGMPRLYSARWR